jgi:hypothetical protein
VVPTLGLHVALMCFLRRVERAEECLLPVNLEIGVELAGARIVPDTEQANFVARCCPAKVLHILGAGGRSQIDQPIVGTVAVDVIDVAGRPLTVRAEPSEAMTVVERALNAQLDVAIRSDRSRSPDLSGSPFLSYACFSRHSTSTGHLSTLTM